MPHDIKIATCCYCGTRTALELRGRERHELACAACGAPLRVMKRLRADHGGKPARPLRPPATPQRKARCKPVKRRRKAFWREALDEVADLVEDLFD